MECSKSHSPSMIIEGEGVRKTDKVPLFPISHAGTARNLHLLGEVGAIARCLVSPLRPLFQQRILAGDASDPPVQSRELAAGRPLPHRRPRLPFSPRGWSPSSSTTPSSRISRSTLASGHVPVVRCSCRQMMEMMLMSRTVAGKCSTQTYFVRPNIPSFFSPLSP